MTPGSSLWWTVLVCRVGMFASILLVAVFVAPSVWMKVVIFLTSAVFLALGLRELRGLEPARIAVQGSHWGTLVSRLPGDLRKRGYEVRTRPMTLHAERRDTLGPHVAFDAIRGEGGIVLLGQRATVRWACRRLGIRSVGPVHPEGAPRT